MLYPTKNAYPTKIRENMHSNTELPNKHHTIKNNTCIDNPMFEFLGIKLYFDDVLLICLIIFLYQEGKNDKYLLIVLILLLLS